MSHFIAGMREYRRNNHIAACIEHNLFRQGAFAYSVISSTICGRMPRFFHYPYAPYTWWFVLPTFYCCYCKFAMEMTLNKY